MGKPRLIIIIRHAQSEGNRDKAIHQNTPDHRVSLTDEGHAQARAAGSKLRALLREDDSLHFFISPYKRTRQTTEGILETLCSNDPAPSPFQRHHIRVYEEPRLREQDFGNFQPGSEEVERLWKERANYGHFFYRIPNGESGADVYDRVSSFNGSLWRRFNEDQMASVAVLVTHGLCSRVFLMAWYHYSVEFFEDLRNINHCEFLVMKLGQNGRYVLQNELRTWSELKRERMARQSISQHAQSPPPHVPVHRWNQAHGVSDQVVRPPPPAPRRQNTADLFKDEDPTQTQTQTGTAKKENSRPNEKPRLQDQNRDQTGTSRSTSKTKSGGKSKNNNDATTEQSKSQITSSLNDLQANENWRDGKGKKSSLSPAYFGRDGGGSRSGAASPFEVSDEEDSNDEVMAAADDGIRTVDHRLETTQNLSISTARPGSLAKALRGELGDPGIVLADALGDRSDAEVEEEDALMGTRAKVNREGEQILADELADRAEEKKGKTHHEDVY